MKTEIHVREVKSNFSFQLLGFAVATGFPVALWILALGRFGYYHRPGNPYWLDAILFGGSTIGLMAIFFVMIWLFSTTSYGMSIQHWWTKAVVKKEIAKIIAPFYIAKLQAEAKRELAESYSKDLKKRGISVEKTEIEEYVDSELKPTSGGALADFES